MRNRLAIRYAVEGDLRFISHHDSMRLFERALARAGLAVRHSQGFNPRPRLTIALPRPVGVASCDELLMVELTSKQTPSDVLLRLSRHMPSGLTLLSAESLADGERRLPCCVRYGLEIQPDMSSTLKARALEFLAQEHVYQERAMYKSSSKKTVDVRAYIRSLTVTRRDLTWTQDITPAGTARVGEVLDALGLPSRDYLHRLRRLEVRYQT